MAQVTNDYLCPVCRTPIRKDVRNRPSIWFHLRLMFGLGILMGIAYLVDPGLWVLKFLPFYLPVWACAEFFHFLQLRVDLNCPTCDFDPVLYRHQWREARGKVEKKLKTLEARYMEEITARRRKQQPKEIPQADAGSKP